MTDCNMRKYIRVTLALLACVSCLCSCSDDDTYADQKKRERRVINSFLSRDVAILDEEGDTICHVGRITPISEAQFYAQDSTTSLERNEYVLFSGSGIYMQIVREGVGERLRSGDNKRILCRFIEYNIMGDSLQLRDDVPYWQVQAENALRNTDTEAWLDGLLDSAEVVQETGMKHVG